MAEINSPIINKVISESVRPMSEKARNLLVLAQSSAAYISATLTSLEGASDSDIIQDNRSNEGVSPITVGQFREAAGLLTDLIATVTADPRLQSVLASCVRTIEVN